MSNNLNTRVEQSRLHSVERSRRYRRRQRAIRWSQNDTNTNDLHENVPAVLELQELQQSLIRQPSLSPADIEFRKRFIENEFGVSCSVCDRLWFTRDLRVSPTISHSLLTTTFHNEDIADFRVCQTCYTSLNKNVIPRLSKSNGFKYPQFPHNLPKLDLITERLISPRIPFMQIRRLRFVTGAKAIIGQVINVPIDVNETVCQLPRQLDDDRIFNVHIKRHIIHKSSYLQGVVQKSVIKVWLQFLLKSPLYRQYNITVNESFFQNRSAINNQDPIEQIDQNAENALDILTAQQQTLMWSDDKYLAIAPGMRQQPLNLVYDEHGEELAFPSIYLGEPRIFTINNVTPYMMASSEIRRKDRRGVKPEHVLYMAVKIMRIRLTAALHITFKNNADINNITRNDIEDVNFVKNCMDHNFAFLKSIPNSATYWFQRKKDLFAMLRQLGKPTLFLTLSASEYKWDHLLKILFKLSTGTEFTNGNAFDNMSALERANLVNEDPVTCCVYFNKLVDTIMFLLCSSQYSPFKQYKVIDFFKRIEFQQRGSPHAHILLWLQNDPKEAIGEHMEQTIRLIENLCSVDVNKLPRAINQTHKHTFTCYKRPQDKINNKCRFEAPFWPVKETIILIPMTTDHGRRNNLKMIYAHMHKSLEFEDFSNLEGFLTHHRIQSYDDYLNILRAGIKRPRIFLKRSIQERWINNFNPWISNVLNSNMDIQFILEPYSCASYVVEYVNKSNRGLSNLHRELIKLRDEYPDKDYTELLKVLGMQMLNAVEISSQEAAWYLLNLHMSESSRKIEFIQTCWPQNRTRIRKSKQQLDDEDVDGESHDIWRENVHERYIKRPENMDNVSLAQFVAFYYKTHNGEYKKRLNKGKIIRYCNYDMTTNLNEYKREMVLLHIPFKNEEIDLLDQNKFLQIYDENENLILQARKEFESDLDINCIMEHCRQLCIEEEEANDHEIFVNNMNNRIIQDDFITAMRNESNNDDIIEIVGNCIVKKRENVMTSEQYCQVMRTTNMQQRDLIIESIYRIFDNNSPPIQIFLTGPAGCGKTFLMRLLMETYNRFTQTRNCNLNSYIASASTGMAASALDGATVHSVFRISNSKENNLSYEALNAFRVAFKNIAIVFIDECSMIGSTLLQQINSRLQQISNDFDHSFGNINIVVCGDLRQLPPVCQTPIYKRNRARFNGEIVWQSLSYYPLVQVVRQSDVRFSSILTKIGNGETLLPDEKCLIESRFATTSHVNENFPDYIRLFFRTNDVISYNNLVVSGTDVIQYIAEDTYTGYSNNEQLTSARNKVHKMKLEETGGLPYMLNLLIGKPYMIRNNIDVIDGLVNGAVGILEYIERDFDNLVIRLWLSFKNIKTGRLLRTKCAAFVQTNRFLKDNWTPIRLTTSTLQLKSRVIQCKRKQFPLVEACAITIHKAQGGTYEGVVYEYHKSHEQQLVYVALSRATTIEGLHITNSSQDHNFYHAKGKMNVDLQTEYHRLKLHTLETISEKCREFLNDSILTFCIVNVQSLSAHSLDISTDSVLSKVNVLMLTETWMANNQSVDIRGFKCIAQNKRDFERSGGVAIFINENIIEPLSFKRHDMNIFSNVFTIHRTTTSRDKIGDICAVETLHMGKPLVFISVYITPGQILPKIKHFLEMNLMIYSLDSVVHEVVREKGLHLMPIILCGDFNLNFNTENASEILTYMENKYNLTMITDRTLSTTRGNTSIDAVFKRNVDNISILKYCSYFSYHHPILGKT